MSIEVRQMTENDRERVNAFHAQAFNAPRPYRELFATVPVEDMRVAEDGGAVVACLRIYRFGHFFGGRSVPAAGIAAVAVAPEARGRRVAQTLMTETLKEVRAEVPVSTLYPATVPLYRRCGYEYGGVYTDYRARLDALPRRSALECEPWNDADLSEIADCYRTFALVADGPVDRPASWWPTRILYAAEEDVYRLCVREDGRITGYVVYVQEKAEGAEWGYDLFCRDLVWTTPGSAEALLTLFGRHRSLGRHVIWHGPIVDPLVGLLDEQDAVPKRAFRAMARLIDAPAALEARGYPPHVRGAFELRLTDDTLPSNAGGWRIEVTDGTAKVAPAPSATATVDVGTLASLYTGLLTAGDAVRLGRLQATADDVAALEAMFAGSKPWMSDFF